MPVIHLDLHEHAHEHAHALLQRAALHCCHPNAITTTHRPLLPLALQDRGRDMRHIDQPEARGSANAHLVGVGTNRKTEE